MRIYLFACCLLLGQINKNVAKNIAITDKPLLFYDLFLNIQNKLFGIQNDIISITASMCNAESFDNITTKIVAAEKNFYRIKQELNKESCDTDAGECGKDGMEMINNHIFEVSVQLKNLQSSLNASSVKRLPLDTIADIKALRFDLAEEKLKKMKSFTEVSKIFTALYTNCSDNFEVLARLIESFTDNKVISFSVQALRDEMSRNDYTNPFKSIRLANILELGVLNQPKVDNLTKQFAQKTHGALKDSIRGLTLDALNTTVSKGKFERHGEMDNLTAAFYILDPLQSENIIEEIVNTNYGQVSSKNILDTITSHRFIQQRARGVSVLFWKIKEAQNLNSDVTIQIASVLHKLRSEKEFENLNQAHQDSVDEIIENLPVCAKNLFFLPSVCFWNKGKEEYLTAGDLSYKYDESRRNTFSTDPLPENHWYVNRTGDNFLFSSRSYDGEYLYAAAFNFNQDLRYVFNWIPGNNTDKQSEWSIELDDDYCYVKSAMYNEYLFSSNHKRPDGNNLRYVFTWVPGHSVRESKFLWQIRKCD